MKRLSIVIAWLLALWLTLWAGWRICHSESDPWDEMYPFWGERPGERSYSVEHRYGNVTFPVHVVMGAKEWVSRQIEQGNCIQEPPNDVDLSVARLYPSKNHSVWWSRGIVDFAGTRYQAVKPTYLLFDTGDCLIYLYDWYTMCTMDALPPPAEVVEPRLLQK